MAVLEWVFANGWRAAGVLGGLMAVGFVMVSRVGAEPRPKQKRKGRRRKS
ncbi:hypothetical protein ACF06W_11810 [Streptomyces albus]